MHLYVIQIKYNTPINYCYLLGGMAGTLYALRGAGARVAVAAWHPLFSTGDDTGWQHPLFSTGDGSVSFSIVWCSWPSWWLQENPNRGRSETPFEAVQYQTKINTSPLFSSGKPGQAEERRLWLARLILKALA